MKKMNIFLSILMLLVVAPVVLAGGLDKKFGSAGKFVSLGADEVIDRDYFAAGKMVEISGTVNGDVYAAGGEIIIDGEVDGDVLVAGGNVTISGNVTQDIRVAGGNVTISGVVGRNVTAVGGEVHLTSTAEIDGSIAVAGGNIRLASSVGGNVKIAAGNAIISSEIDGFVHARIETFRLTSKAEIGDNLVYWSFEDAAIDEDAVVSGEITKHIKERPEVPRKDLAKVFLGMRAFFKLISLLTILVLGLLMVSFYPKFSQKTAETIQDKPWSSLGLGFLFLVVTPIVAIILMITVVGMQLAMILMFSYFIFLIVAKVFAVLLIGYWSLRIFSKNVKPGWSMLTGAVVFYVITFIPVIGSVIMFVALLLGMGAALITKRQVYYELKSKL